MTKRQLIDEIVGINRTAEPRFLARFDDEELGQYLDHLRRAQTPRLSGDPHRYDKYFRNLPTVGCRPSRQGAVAAVFDADAAAPTDRDPGGADIRAVPQSSWPREDDLPEAPAVAERDQDDEPTAVTTASEPPPRQGLFAWADPRVPLETRDETEAEAFDDADALDEAAEDDIVEEAPETAPDTPESDSDEEDDIEPDARFVAGAAEEAFAQDADADEPDDDESDSDTEPEDGESEAPFADEEVSESWLF